MLPPSPDWLIGFYVVGPEYTVLICSIYNNEGLTVAAVSGAGANTPQFGDCLVGILFYSRCECSKRGTATYFAESR